MKKIVSLFIAILLIVSMFSVSVLAFADEETPVGETTPGESTGEGEATEPTPSVTVHNDALFSLPAVKDFALLRGMTKSFKLDYSWLKDEAAVASVFEGIVYHLSDNAKAENSTKPYEVTDESFKISVEFCRPDKDYKGEWESANVGSDILATSAGWWGFRYVVKKGTERLAQTDTIYVYFSDEAAPTFRLGNTMKEAVKDGIKVGKTYSISTSLTVTEDSSYKTTYVVYRRAADGNWMAEPIYDSKTQTVAEGYTDKISKSGVITMQEDDVLTNDAGEGVSIYKVVYTVTDGLGYVTYSDDTTVLEIKAVAEPVEKMSATDVWKIVLYCIAGLSAVGIIVVLCIPSKEKKPAAPAAPASDDSSK